MGPDLVECYSGTVYAERPVALHWQGRRLEVDRVLAEWRTPEGKAFLVSTVQGQDFELTYNESAGNWQIRER